MNAGRYESAVGESIAKPSPAIARLARQLDELSAELGEETIKAAQTYAQAAKHLVAGVAVLPTPGTAERCHVLAAQLEVLMPVFKDLFLAEAGRHYREPWQAPPTAPAMTTAAAIALRTQGRTGKRRAEDLPAFDADLPPTHPTNRAAAAARGLRYVPDREVYVDADGCPALDQFGQVLG